MLALCQWLEQTSVGSAIRESLWLFPALETLHLFGVVALVGSISIFDLRLLGLLLRGASVHDLYKRLIPWTWAGFSIQVVTGLLLFASEAHKIYVNPAFRLKMILIALAGVNALVFQLTAYRRISRSNQATTPPFAAKISGLVSMVLWLAVIAAGRFIGFL